MQEIITWISNNKETVASAALGVYTLIVRLFPTNKNLDFVGQILSYMFPNKKTGGGVH